LNPLPNSPSPGDSFALKEYFVKKLGGNTPRNKLLRIFFDDLEGRLMSTIGRTWEPGVRVVGSDLIFAEDGMPYLFLCFQGFRRKKKYVTPFLIQEVVEQ